LTQLLLSQCKGFNKKVGERPIVPVVLGKVQQQSLPERLVGKIRVCEFCGTFNQVQIIECMYLCPDCFKEYGELHSFV